MKIHVSLAAGRALLYGLVVDEEKHQEVASVHLPGECEDCVCRALTHCVWLALMLVQPLQTCFCREF